MLFLEWKESAFKEKWTPDVFVNHPAAILVHQNGAPIQRLHAKLYKGAWNFSSDNSETEYLRLGQIVYILVFYNTSFSWLLPLDDFQFIFLLRDSENVYRRRWYCFGTAQHKPVKSQILITLLWYRQKYIENFVDIKRIFPCLYMHIR